MKKYIVTFGHTRAEADAAIKSSRHSFDTLAEARTYAADYYNAYISAVDNNGIINYIKTRQDIKHRTQRL